MENTIQLHDKKFRIMIPAEQIDRAVDAVPYPAPLREFLARIFAYDWRPDASSTVTRDNLLAAEQMLIGYLQRLLGHPLKSLVFIHQLG